MRRRQRIDGNKYLLVFTMTTLIFIAGILTGNHFSIQKLEQVDEIGQELKTDTVAMELQYELVAEDPCAHLNSTFLADEIYEMASKLDYMENRMGENDKNVKDIKEYYSLLEIRHWLFMKKTQKECNETSSLILFFYNNEDACAQCKEQGFILTWARRNFENVYVYSFDHTIEDSALNTIKEMHSITGTPSVVIDGEVFNRFMSKNELENRLTQKGLERK